MQVESDGGIALGLSRPRTILRGMIAGSLTIATGAALLLAAPAAPAASAREIDGTAGDDHIVGTLRLDLIHALDGDDVVTARDGFDAVWGDWGDDIIRLGPNGGSARGGPGNDKIFGGVNFVDGQTLRGGPGRDELIGRAGREGMVMDRGPDSAFGRAGNDYFFLAGGVDIARGGPGVDRFEVLADGRPDQIACGPGTDFVVFVDAREAHDRTTAACERHLYRGIKGYPHPRGRPESVSADERTSRVGHVRDDAEGVPSERSKVWLILIILAFALLGLAGYRVSKHRGDQTLDGNQHELWQQGRKGGGGGLAGG